MPEATTERAAVTAAVQGRVRGRFRPARPARLLPRGACLKGVWSHEHGLQAVLARQRRRAVNAAEICKSLKGRWTGDSGTARCPAHDDKTPSLSISNGPEDRVLVHCHAGCSQEAVIEALMTRNLWPNGHDREYRPPPKKRAAPPTNGAGPDFARLLGVPPADVWDYRTADGCLLGYVARVERTAGKSVIPVTYNGSHWVCEGFAEPRPLYRLEALAAAGPRHVLLVEGEKTAVAAQELFDEYTVTTWPGGTNAVAKADWGPLRGREVTLWPDADEPGAKAMVEVAKLALAAGAKSVRRVEVPPGLPKGWDLADEIPADMDVGELLDAAQDVREAAVGALPLRTAAVIERAEYPELRWAVRGLVPDGVTILAGSKSRGKSFISLDFALAVAAGTAALGNVPCDPGPVLYLGLEDSERRIQARMRAILQGDPAPMSLDIATEWRTADKGGLDDIEAWVHARPGARLVIVDVLAKIKGRPDPRKGIYDQDYDTVGPYHAMARRLGIAIIIVHHTNKGQADDPVLRISGTMGLSGAADTTLVLSREARDPHGTLDVRGRDVAEREIALRFDPDTGCVTQLGPAQDFRRSQERQAIIKALIDCGPMKPAEVAQAIGKKTVNVRSTLRHMKTNGEVSLRANGQYEATEYDLLR